jgi:hypothetical protein
MNFEDLLRMYFGRTIEVFTDNEMYEGRLIVIGRGYIIVEVAEPPYTAPSNEITIFIQGIQFVRVIAA